MINKNQISKYLNEIGLQSLIWRVLFELHLDATSHDADYVNAAKSASRHFYGANKKLLNEVISMFDDQLSKRIFYHQIKYRLTYDRKYARPYNMWNQYFPKDIVKLGDNEVFVDCGAYVGDTVKQFLKKTGGKYQKVICFEPDFSNYRKLNKLADRYVNIITYRKGTYSSSGKMYFNSLGSSSSDIANVECVGEGQMGEEVEVVALDDISECCDVSFLKMDIEGAEWETLKGADRIIRKNKPILAICIYHSDEDMIRIPKLIKEKYPWYRLYVRQHFFLPLETVLYAIPN